MRKILFLFLLIILFIAFPLQAQEVRISDLPEATTADSDDIVPVVVDMSTATPVTSYMTFGNMIVYLLNSVSITKSGNNYTFPGLITTTAADGLRGLIMSANTSAWSTCTAGVYGITIVSGALKACINGTLHSISYSD